MSYLTPLILSSALHPSHTFQCFQPPVKTFYSFVSEVVAIRFQNTPPAYDLSVTSDFLAAFNHFEPVSLFSLAEQVSHSKPCMCHLNIISSRPLKKQMSMQPLFHILDQCLNSWKKSWRKLPSERKNRKNQTHRKSACFLWLLRSERKYRCHFEKVITSAGSLAEEALHIQKSRRRSFPLSLNAIAFRETLDCSLSVVNDFYGHFFRQ